MTHRSITCHFDDHLQVVQALLLQANAIERMGLLLVEALRRGGKILLCGNGGSAADAQHIAAEMVGRFNHSRPGLPALALTTDTSVLTSVANDFGYEHVFSRQVEALGREGDVLVGLSTSGNSRNVLVAMHRAREMGLLTVAMLGGDGGALRAVAEHALVVPSNATPVIQECHIMLGHIWCGMVDEAFRHDVSR